MTEVEFERYYGRVPTAFLLVARDGTVRAANRTANSVLQPFCENPVGASLPILIQDRSGKLVRYLDMCRGSLQFLPGSLMFTSGSGKAQFRCDGALPYPESDAVLLRLKPKTETNLRFLALNDKIERLAYEINERTRTEMLLAGQNEVLELIAQDAQLPAVLDRLVRVIEAYLAPSVLASVLLLRDGRLRHGAAPSLPEAYNRAVDGLLIGPFAGSCGTAAFTARPVIVHDIASDPLWKDYKDLALVHGLRACWSTPIMSADGLVLGTFAMYHRTMMTPTEDMRDLTRLVARTAAIAIARDSVRERVRELLAQQSAMLDGLPARIALLDRSGVIRGVNETWAGWSSGQRLVTGTSFLDVCDGAFQATDGLEVSGAVRDVLSGERASVSLDARTTAGQETRWVRLSVAPVPGLDGGRDVIVMHLDVTESKLAEEALAKQASELVAINSELQQFAYVASHDLREPLRTIKSFAQLFVRRFQAETGEEGAQYLNYISEGVSRMEDLLEDLLIYSRVAHGAELQRAPLCLSDALTTALRNLQAIIDETGAVIHSEPLPTVDGFPTQLTQILQNLISNAIKYRSDAAPQIRIGAERAGDCWTISVSDNGIGIDPQYHASIFGLFKRLHSRQVPGTGIGLALCKKIAEAHGGNIWVESEPGAGSTFRFTIADTVPAGAPMTLTHGHA